MDLNHIVDGFSESQSQPPVSPKTYALEPTKSGETRVSIVAEAKRTLLPVPYLAAPANPMPTQISLQPLLSPSDPDSNWGNPMPSRTQHTLRDINIDDKKVPFEKSHKRGTYGAHSSVSSSASSVSSCSSWASADSPPYAKSQYYPPMPSSIPSSIPSAIPKKASTISESQMLIPNKFSCPSPVPATNDVPALVTGPITLQATISAPATAPSTGSNNLSPTHSPSTVSLPITTPPIPNPRSPAATPLSPPDSENSNSNEPSIKIPVVENTEVYRVLFDSKTRQFTCSKCSRQFARKSDLVRHLRIHLGIQPNACDVCGKRFIQRSALKVHKRVHTGEKPYRCQVCSRPFSDSSSLARHRRIHLRQEVANGQSKPAVKTCATKVGAGKAAGRNS